MLFIYTYVRGHVNSSILSQTFQYGFAIFWQKYLQNIAWLCFGAGLPDGIFSNQNPNLGKFCRVLQWKMLIY
jgi:hypothetical protein